MATLFDFLPMLASQKSGAQQLTRQLEPANVTAATENVVQYDQVTSTQLTVAYAAGLTAAFRASADHPQQALDLACGPGHFTLCLARYLNCQRVTGLDLSPGMVETSNQNANKQGVFPRARFAQADITDLKAFRDKSIQLTTFADAAHHLPDISLVQRTLREMDRVTDGLVMVMDLARLRTEALTEKYVKTLGHDYKARGLPAFFDDFRNSMFAAWTVDELREAIPRDSDRYWCHWVPLGLPTLQIVLGLPVGRKEVFVRKGFPWTPETCPVPRQYRSEWRILRTTLALGPKTMIPPGK